MIRLALLAAATYAVWRIWPRVVDENRSRVLLPAPSPDNRPPVGLKDNQTSLH
jgi:hypothetical protein